MSYAVIRTGGKQYRVSEGDTLRVEKLEVEPGQELELSDLLLVAHGEELITDPDQLKKLKVKANVLRHGRARKIRVFTFKRRKGFHKHKGHRQGFTEIQISSIP